MKRNRSILVTGALLVITVAVFGATSLDLTVQDRFYDPVHGWRVDRDAPLPKLIFYDIPRVGIVVLDALLLVWAVGPARRWARVSLSRREAAFLFLCVTLVPFTAGALKKATGVFPPCKVARYGGVEPYRTLLASVPYDAGRERGRGFPAGHCSGGFALMGLYFFGKRRATRLLGLLVGLVAGWSVGTYQMLKGAHYLSHTIVTMILAWLIVQLLARAFQLDEPTREAGV